jgi:PmbA protein
MLDQAEGILAAAMAAGADAAEVYLSRSRRSEVRVRDAGIERSVRSDGSGCGLRVDRGFRQGFASTTDLTREGLRLLLDSALAVAGVAPEDPDGLIPEAGGEAPAAEVAGLHDPALEDLSFETALDLARRTEQGALAADGSVRPGEGSSFSWGGGSVAVVNSRGVRRHHAATHGAIVCAPVAGRSGEMQREHWFESRCSLEALPEPEEVGREAGRRAAMMLGARPIPSGRVNVVFDPMEGSRFWSSLTSAMLGDAARRKVSFLADALGSAVASTAVTLADEPTIPGRPGGAPFDGEGVPTSRTELIERGVLTRFMYDTRSARRAATTSTGHAVRGYSSPPCPGAHAPLLLPGALPPEAILKQAGRGLYVTRLIGFGTNLVTGDYSRGASGWWFEDGAFAHPVQEVTLSGNLLDLLKNIGLVGSDMDHASGLAAPTFLVEGLVASGGAR